MTARRLDYLASFRLLFRFIRGSRLLLAGALLSAMIAAFCELLPIWLLTKVIRSAMDGSLAFGSGMQSAAFMLAGIAACFIATGLAAVLGHLAAFRAILRMRVAIVEHMARVPLGLINTYSTGDAKRLVLDDPDGLEGLFAHGLPDGIGAFCLLAAISIWLIAVDWLVALSGILPAVAGLGALVIAMRRSERLAMTFQATSMKMNASIVEMLGGIAVLKVFRGGIGTGDVRRAVREHTRAETAMSVDYIPFGTVFTTLISANVAFMLPVGLLRVDKGVLAPADLLFTVVLGTVYSPALLKLFAQFHRFASISLNATLADKLFAIEPQYDCGEVCDLKRSDVAFERVSFAYNGTPILKDVNFVARQGQMTALVGPSGGGKTTIVSLLPRLFDAASGTIAIGGVDIRKLGLRQLQDTVALLPQQPFLFDDTLLENIRIGRLDASEAEIAAALRAAQLEDFVDRLPEGAQTRLGRGGTTPSGGERQRIAIARLLLKDAPIVILDEATAFLDRHNEIALMRAIDALAVNRTVLVIAHRLNTVRKAANILVIDQGQVREQGMHEELLARNALYSRLWENDFAHVDRRHADVDSKA